MQNNSNTAGKKSKKRVGLHSDLRARNFECLCSSNNTKCKNL